MFRFPAEVRRTGDLGPALGAAVRGGDLPRVKMLLDRGAVPGATILQSAALSPVAIPDDMIRTWIAKGADINAKTSFAYLWWNSPGGRET
jgi:hypothetical protein